MSEPVSSTPLADGAPKGGSRLAASFNTNDPAVRRTLRLQGLFLFALAILFLIVWQAPPQHIFEGISRYAWLHAVLETFSIVIASMVFGVAWNAYSHERPGQILLLAAGMLVTGIIHFVHMLSFAGMPELVTPSDPEKAINFWLTARYVFAVLLLLVAFRPWRPLSRPSLRYAILAGSLVFVAFVIWFGLFHQDLLPRTFIKGQGLTPLKVGAEYVLVGLFAVAAFAFLRMPQREAGYNAQSLFVAAVVSILGELCFTLYSDVTDIFNLLGHVYTGIAFGFVYRGVFVTSVREPFERVVRAEARTRAASAYARSLIEASLDPLVTIDSNGTVTGANEAMEDVTGHPIGKLVGSDFSSYFTEPEKARAIYRAVIEHGEARDHQLVIRHIDGRQTHVLCNGSVYCDEKGAVAGIFVAGRDVTEAKRAEEALRQAHTLLSNIMDTSPIGITVWNLDGQITFANAEAQNILGRPKEKLTGLSYNACEWHITDLSGRTLLDDDLPFRKAIISGQPMHEVEMAIDGLDGKRVLLSVNVSPLYGQSGKIEGVVATLNDISERKAAEEKLRATEQRLAQAMTAARMGAWTWDAVTEKLTYSEEYSALLGLRRGESHPDRHAFFACVHPDDRVMLAEKLRRALVGDQDYWADFRVIWPDGSIHWIGVHCSMSYDATGKPLKLSGIGMDISERKAIQLALERAYRTSRTLSAANDKLIHAQDEASLLEQVCRVIVETGGYRMAWVGKALDDALKTVQPVASYGDTGNFLEATTVLWSDTELGQGPTGAAIRTGATQINQNYLINPHVAPWRDEAQKRGYQASIAFPLRDAGGVHGSLTIYAGEADAFIPDEVRLLQELADDLAFGIATLRTRAERDRMLKVQQEHDSILRKSLVESIQAVATTLELRDPYTAGHQRRVAALASAIGREVGLSESAIEGLHLAASIHDVGKIQIPSEILNKPGKISPIEMDLIRTHAQAGHDIVKDVQFPWPIARIILEHHERLDGSGYPNHLKREDLLLESRVLMVADVVEAMMSHRPYRPGRGLDAALDHITTYRGIWFEPQAVDACLRLFREKGYELGQQED